MNQITKILLAIAVILAVVGYTIYNFVIGQTNMTYFLVYMAILCLPLANMVNILIREIKNK